MEPNGSQQGTYSAADGVWTEAFRTAQNVTTWTGTLGEYLELLAGRPEIAESAHARLYRMICAGARPDAPYAFFADELYGLDGMLKTLVEDYFHAAALGLDVKKRLLLLMGPVSGGKSTLVWLLKRGLEAFSRTEPGALYGIAGCPMHEEPLHLLPEGLRAEAARQLPGIQIQGHLCPVCQYRLAHEWNGQFLQAPVERVWLSEAGRVGIGTFVPSDPKSQDIADLVGSLDFSTITRYGSEADPRAFSFDGELYRANRGIMEFQEMLKLDEKFLYHLLGLTQEGTFKAGRFPLISADQVVVGHTNEAEFRAFSQNPRNEALMSRMMVIKVPYPLDVTKETRIYRKLLSQSPVPRAVHFAPGALEAAAVVSVVSRLNESQRPGLDLLAKAAVLAGEEVRGLAPEDRDAVREEARHEGMTGLDPRYVVNRIASAVIARQEDCLTAADILRSIRDGVEQHAAVDKLGTDKVNDWVALARTRYDAAVRAAVQRAFLGSFEEHARALFNNYLDNVELSLRQTPRTDPVTGNAIAPDEDLMRSLEEPMGITEGQRRSFREEVWLRIAASGGRSEAWTHRVHPVLSDAVEAKLFMDLKDLVKITTGTGRKDPEQDQKIQAVASRLREAEGFCERCAMNTVHYVGALLNR